MSMGVGERPSVTEAVPVLSGTFHLCVDLFNFEK